MEKVGLGCASFGNCYSDEITQDDCTNLIEYAYKNGVRYFDTAPWYGNRLSEKRLGKAIKNIDRNTICVSTKVGRYCTGKMFDFSRESVKKSVDMSLNLMEVEYFDCLFAHDIEFSQNPSLIINETLAELDTIRTLGKTKYIGISGYDLEFLKTVVENSTVKIDFVLTYARYTLINTDLNDYISVLKSKGAKVIAASATSMGLLTNKDPPSWHPAATETMGLCQDIRRYCEMEKIDVAELAHHYFFNNKEIDNYLLGSAKISELHSSLNHYNSGANLEADRHINYIINNILNNCQTHNWTNVEIKRYKLDDAKD